MNMRYGDTQVCEFVMSEADVIRMIGQSISERCDPSYDFDKSNPIVLRTENGGYIVRFVQKKVTVDADKGSVWMKPLPKRKDGE